MDSVTVIKFFSALLYPLGLVFSFAIIGLLGRFLFRRGRLRALANFSLFLSIAALLVFSNPMVASWLTRSLEQQYPQLELDRIEPHDVVIVLGGGLRIPLPPTQHSQLSSASDRYWYATRLYKAGKARQIILSGGNVYAQEGYKGEAYYAKELLQEWGVPSSAILVEDQSRTTIQNRDGLVDAIQKNKVSSALLVTSATHMPRAYELFQSLPIRVTPASADTIIRDTNAPRIFSWMPSSGALALSTRALHEYYGKWFNELKALISSA